MFLEEAVLGSRHITNFRNLLLLWHLWILPTSVTYMWCSWTCLWIVYISNICWRNHWRQWHVTVLALANLGNMMAKVSIYYAIFTSVIMWDIALNYVNVNSAFWYLVLIKGSSEPTHHACSINGLPVSVRILWFGTRITWLFWSVRSQPISSLSILLAFLVNIRVVEYSGFLKYD
jgi:hypothetical protein